MQFRRQSSNEDSINLTPLIDVVFLLLIFFLVTTTFKTERNLVIELPKAEGQAALTEVDIVDIMIDRTGQYTINGEVLINNEIDTLKRQIGIASEGNNQLPLVISADENTPFQSVVRVMDIAGQLGFSTQRITAQRPTSE